MSRLVIITEIISPYRIPLFNALAQNPDVDLHVIFLGETDPNLREWRVYKEEIRFSFEVLPSWRKRFGRYNVLLNRSVAAALLKADPQAILCGGYNYVASWQALMWARKHHVRFDLWSESNGQDKRGDFAVTEFLKRQFMRRCDRFIVPGSSALDYLKMQNIPQDSIFIAPNAVDNRLFSDAASSARNNAVRLRTDLKLPHRYFLFVGRLVRDKGVFELLSSYAMLQESLRREIGLVFIGDGPCRTELQQRAAGISTGAVCFGGFVHRDGLGAYYGLADALVLPTYTDTWGMVVNEAMASGLPIILSDAAGCAADLVREEWNGLLVKPGDVDSLADAMTRIAADHNLRDTMSANSAGHILAYSPEAWACSVAAAIR